MVSDIGCLDIYDGAVIHYTRGNVACRDEVLGPLDDEWFDVVVERGHSTTCLDVCPIEQGLSKLPGTLRALHDGGVFTVTK
jgi:hypothetical protein